MSLRKAGYVKVALALGFVFCLMLQVLITAPAKAAVTLVQTGNNFSTSTSTTVNFSSSATSGNLLVVICGTNLSVSISAPSGYSTAINESGSAPGQAIFYKVAAGGESSATCNVGSSTTTGIHYYEYSGVHTYQTFELVNASPSTGNNGTPSSGSLTTVHQYDLLVAAISVDDNINLGAWNNSFIERNSFGQTGGKRQERAYFIGADRIVSSSGTYSTTYSSSLSTNWRGQIAAFRVISDSPSLVADILDGADSTVGSPSVSMSNTNTGFTCQTSSGSLATSPNKIRVQNTTDNPAWSLAIAATNGATANWISSSYNYDFNDPSGSGCSGGQLTVDPSGASLASQASCPVSGVSVGSSAAFSQGMLDSVTIATANSPAYVDCYWDISNISLTQKVPPGQHNGSYNLNLTITVTSS